MTTMDTAFFRSWMSESAQIVAENAEQLSRLDAAIGDGDHGTNLLRGFAAALSALENSSPQIPGDVLSTVGKALISKTGGAAGPLYGAFFRRAGRSLGTASAIDAAALGDALSAGTDAVRGLGKATEGEKTMIDALSPAVRAYHNALSEGGSLSDATSSAALAAEQGALATIPLEARKGRASYLGPRSVGHQDPGARSSALILQALSTVAGRGD